MRNEIAAEIQAAGAKLTPVVALAGAKAAGWGPQEWMYALTAAYVVLQGAYLLWKWHREWKARRGK